MIVHLKSTLKAIGLGLVVGSSLALPNTSAETRSIEVPAGQSTDVDLIMVYDEDTCNGLLSDAKIRKPAKNGVLSITTETVIPSGGHCGGRGVTAFKVTYRPDNGFRGADAATISYRSPPQLYYQRQTTILRTRSFKMIVK